MMNDKLAAELAYARDWTHEHATAAGEEGWFLSNCSGSVYGDWQIQKIDNPDEGQGELDDDAQAWRLVLDGPEEAHHRAALEFVARWNPAELIYWLDAVGPVDLSDDIKVLAVKARLTA